MKDSFLLSEKPSELMVSYSLPCVISLLIAALYNIVDQIYIANAPYLTSNGNAANTVVFPLTVLALAFVWIGDGSCAFSSISLGRKEEKKAAEALGNAVVLAAAAGILIMIVYFFFFRTAFKSVWRKRIESGS